MKRLSYLSMIVLALSFGLCSADMAIVQKTTTGAYAIMGTSVPAAEKTMTYWMSKECARADLSADTSVLINAKEGSVTMLFHKSKTYSVIMLPTLQKAMEKMTAEEKARIKSVTDAMKSAYSVTATAEKKKIKTWNCTKYLMTMTMGGMTVTSEIWASEEVKIDYTMYNKLKNSLMSGMPGMQDMLKEMEKIKGLPVVTSSSSTIMGAEVKSTEEVLDVKEKTAPAGFYAVPAGYKQIKLY
jgi:hypothetical protein